MPYQRPTLTQIINRVLADMGRFVGAAGSVLRRSVVGVIGHALAGASNELHGRLDFISRQILPDTAESEYLRRWAAVWGVLPKPAEYASGAVVFTGTNGAAIPFRSVLQRQDGALFETATEGLISGGTALVQVMALEAGAAGNTPGGLTLTLQQPIAGVQVAAVIQPDGIVGGSEAETDQSLLARLLARIQQPPQGGAAYDYVRWAREVPGVTRAWAFPQEMGPGSVTVRFVRDDDESIIPDAAEVDAVWGYIDGRRPVTAELYVVAPIAVALDFEIQLNPNTVSVRLAVEAELADLIRREAVPGGTILISRIREAVSTAAGEADNVVVSPTANVTHGPGEMAVLGSITFGPIV